MIFLAIVASIAFFLFYRRAAGLVEKQRIFWGVCGMATICAPSAVVGSLVAIIAYWYGGVGGLSEYTQIFLASAGVVAWLAGFGLAQWVLNRFLPARRRLVAAYEDSDADEFSSNAL